MDTGASCEEKEEFAGCVGVVGGFGDVAVYVVEFCDLAGGGLGGGEGFCGDLLVGSRE